MFKTISQSIMRGRKKGIIYVHVNCFWDSKLLLDAKMNPEKWAHKTKKIPFHDSFRCFRSQTRSFLTKLNQKVPSRGMFNALQLLKGAQTQQTKPTPLLWNAPSVGIRSLVQTVWVYKPTLVGPRNLLP